MDLEQKFSLWLFTLLGLGCLTYVMLDAQRTSVTATIARALVIGAIASGVAHYALFKPIRQLLVMATSVRSGDFSKRLTLHRQDEIGSLAIAMDTMCDQLQAAQVAAEDHIIALDQLRHSDRIATLGRLASSVAHELGNPLNVIELRAQLISSGDVSTLYQAQQNAVVIVEQTRRMARIIDEILSFARMQPAKIQRLDLVGLVRKAIVLSEHISKKRRTRIVFDAPSVTEIDGDADKLLQVVVNLVVNGVQAMQEGGTLTLGLCNEERAHADDSEGPQRSYVRIDVSDQGVGIAKELLGKVFEPFFSTKSADGGTGLGLSVAQGIAREHEGWISVDSEPGQGATFRVYLPKQGLQADDGYES